MENKIDTIADNNKIIGYMICVKEVLDLINEGYETDDIWSIMRGRALDKSYIMGAK